MGSRQLSLGQHNVLGRSRLCSLRLADPTVSGADDQEILNLDKHWVLRLSRSESMAVAPTLGNDPNQLPIEQIEFRFRVSRDQEHIELTLVDGLSEIALGARAHHEMLLALARGKLKIFPLPSISVRSCMCTQPHLASMSVGSR